MVRYNNHCKPIGNIVMQDIRLDDSNICLIKQKNMRQPRHITKANRKGVNDMSKKTRAERNFKFETLQLHVGQEKPDPVTGARRFRFIRHHPMYLTTAIMQRRALNFPMQETFTAD